MAALLKAFPVDTWVGLSTSSSDPTFKWADGTAVDYTRWADNQPEGGTVSDRRAILLVLQVVLNNL